MLSSVTSVPPPTLCASGWSRRLPAPSGERPARSRQPEPFTPLDGEPSPGSRARQSLVNLLHVWLRRYAERTPGTECHVHARVRPNCQSLLCADVLLRVWSGCHCRCRLAGDGAVAGPPELLVRIIATEPVDELEACRQAGVGEFLVWNLSEGRVQWHVLDQGRYRPRASDAAGVIRSRSVNGLWLDVNALLARDVDGLLRTLNAGLNSEEHRAYCAWLAMAEEWGRAVWGVVAR